MTEFEKYENMYGDMYEKQLALEIESKLEAEKHIKEVLLSNELNGRAGESKLGSRFTEYAWQNCRANIHALLEDVKKPKKTTQGGHLVLLKDLLRIYQGKEEELENMLSLVTLSRLISSAFDVHHDELISFSRVASIIANSIENEVDIENFFNQKVAEGVNRSWLVKSMDSGIQKRVQASYKIAYAINRMHKENYKAINWTATDKVCLGSKLIEMVIKGSDFFQLVPHKWKDNKSLMCIEMTDWFLQAWQVNVNNMIANAVHYHPTIIPPKEWSSPFCGGYYGECTKGIELLRLTNFGGNNFIHNYHKRLNVLNLSFIYETVNAIQSTPFVINKKILNVLQEIWAKGGDMCGVPRTSPLEQLPKLGVDTTKEELKDHKKKMVAIYRLEARRKSIALRFLYSLQEAKKFSEYDKIYFPWNMDFRGRCYPIPTSLSPQGDDTQKSLLLFAEGTPLAGEEDLKWLYIHGANLAGHDKINFDERQAWVREHISDILSSAKDPLGYLWWYEESKGDYPMEFLAFCFEVERLFEYKAQNNGAVKGFVSNLPIAFDGTCSGLQHFSALLRDEIGGHAVNLVPSDKVQDIYSLVADKVNKQLLDDVINGTNDETKTNKEGKESLKLGTQTLARQWVMFNRIKFGKDGITRKVCKRSVMTLAYGSKQYGFAENIQEDIIKPFCAEHQTEGEAIFPKVKQSAVYMAKLIWGAVKTTVVKAVEGMEWLQKMSTLITNGHHAVSWITPNGLLIQQNYMEMAQDTIQARFNGARVRLYSRTEKTGCINKSKQASGIAPNFIHSLDASHLQRVVHKEYELGNTNFMMIHDSFGTDVAHAGQLFKTIRDEFVKMYTENNVFVNFLEDVKGYIAEEDRDKIPTIPAMGKLDIELVKYSDFCFA